jgi:hypothetical protein
MLVYGKHIIWANLEELAQNPELELAAELPSLHLKLPVPSKHLNSVSTEPAAGRRSGLPNSATLRKTRFLQVDRPAMSKAYFLSI